MFKNLKHIGVGKLSAIATALVLVSPLVGATVVTNSILASGSYSLGGSSTTVLTDPSDVLSFPGSYGQANSAGLHSYGSPFGNFGSRSSGYGVYDVTGGFKIVQTITNDTASAQNASFNFFITPGQLNNDIASGLTGAQFVSSGLMFDLRRDNVAVWGSTATLNSTSAGTVFATTGTNLYSGGGAYYAVNGVSQTVDLGVINAGTSITLSYELTSFAKGNALGGPVTHVDETSYVVPGQWVENTVCDNYGEGLNLARVANQFVGDGYGGTCITERVFIPEHTVVVPGYDVSSGRAGGSTAQSGDPFDIVGNGGITFQPIGNSFDPFTQGASTSNIPEPSSLALMLSSLGILGWSVRRRRSAAA